MPVKSNATTVTKPNATLPNAGSANAALGQDENEVLTPEKADTSGGVGGKGDLINVLDGQDETVTAEKSKVEPEGPGLTPPTQPKQKK
ncbi:MAG: hypothetical protein FWF44_07465 [Defluviitaleaceae bacterium]|nr:hypothetical protein [Defluviitaleaceae bacterium]